MPLPLKNVIYATALLLAVILGGLLILGAGQHRLQKNHEQIISQSEKLLFQFATTREHIIESLLENRYDKLADIAKEIESLNSNITKIVENAHIPGEFKLSFINQIDLPGLVLLLRRLAADQTGRETKLLQMNRETRILGERLVLFDRLIVNYAKIKVINFQNMVIGALAIVVFTIVSILVLGHRQVAIPLIELVRQVKEVTQGRRQDIFLKFKRIAGEVSELTKSFRDLLQTRSKTQADFLEISGALASSRAHYRQLFESTADAVMLADAAGQVLDCNPSALHVFQGGDHQIDGLNIFQELCRPENGEEKQKLALAMQNGEAVTLQRPFGMPPRQYRVLLQPIVNSPGSSHPHVLVIARDLTSENVCGSVTVRISQLATLGEMATGAAHDINNLSNGIINYAQLATDELENSPRDEQRHLLARIIKEGERIAHIAQLIIAFGRKEERAATTASGVITGSLAMLGPQFKNDGIKTSLDLPEDLLLPRVNVQQLRHALINIFGNARHALNRRYPTADHNKLLEIKGQIIRTDRPDRQGWLRIAVTDHGTGIDPAILDKFFDPAFTMPAGEDSGLGLYISRELIRENRGRLNIESKPGAYTTVTIDLPVE